MYYVNEYLCNREYGGPEEGGWWYDTGEFLECHGVFKHESEAYDHMDSLNRYLDDRQKDLEDEECVNCTGFPRIFVEPHEGKDYPEHAPHYE